MKKVLLLLIALCKINVVSVGAALPPYKQSESANNELERNYVQQKNVSLDIAGIRGVELGIWLPFIASSYTQQNVSMFDIGKALLVTTYTRKELTLCKKQQKKLKLRALLLQNVLGNQKRVVKDKHARPLSLDIFEHFCAGFVISSLAHLALKPVFDRDNVSEMDVLINCACIVPLGTALFVIACAKSKVKQEKLGTFK